MNTFRNLLALLAFALVVTITACSKEEPTPNPEPEPEVHEFGFTMFAGQGQNTTVYQVSVPSLTEGILSVKNNGAEIPFTDLQKLYGGTYYKGYYYSILGGKLFKFQFKDNKFSEVAALPIANVSVLEDPIWIDDKTLLAMEEVIVDKKVVSQYSTVDINDMSVTSSGSVELMDLPDNHETIIMGGHKLIDGKIINYFSFNNGWEGKQSSTPSYLSTYDYPSFDNVTLDIETRSAWPGGNENWTNTSFVAENKDVYVMATPMAARFLDLPSGIFRIKKGVTEFDPNYFLALDHSSSIYYLGNNKAIVTTVTSQVTQDNYGDIKYKYHLIDVITGEKKVLDVPAYQAQQVINVVVHDGKAYMAVVDTEDAYVWEYDPATDKIKKGLKFEKGFSDVVKVDKYK